MAEYRELHYPGDVTADLPPGEPLGWDAGQRPYVILQSYLDPGWPCCLTDDPAEHLANCTGQSDPERTVVVLQPASPDDIRRWIDTGAWLPEVMAMPRRMQMGMAAHRADMRAGV